jgi:SAM-dependent methyltransferase
MHFRLLLCQGCDLLYASPAPTAAALASAYGDATYDSQTEAAYAADTYLGLVRPVLPSLPSRRGALDIGAGDGAFLSRLLDLGFTDVVGVEPSRAPIACAPARIRQFLRRGIFRAGEFVPDSLSLASCFQTLEHVDEPLSLVREVRALLRPGGVFVAVCHDFRALSARLLGRKSPIFDLEHMQIFSATSLRTLLRRAGFAAVEVHPIWNRYPARYWMRLLPLPDGLRRRLQHLPGAALPMSIPGGNLGVVARKV